MYTCHNEPVPNRNQTNTVGEDGGRGAFDEKGRGQMGRGLGQKIWILGGSTRKKKGGWG